MSIPWFPTPAPCVRRAWLTLGSLSVDLENPGDGWFCTELDLGYPSVRDVVSNRPDQDGIDDRTSLFGARAVSAKITTAVGAGARIDQVAAMFGPFMQPAQRPTLHVILDRPGAAERTMVVRPAGYAWTVAGADQRDIALQFVASDPYLYDPTVQTAIAWTGSGTAQGRLYPRTFPHTYPTGGTGGTQGFIRSYGDLPIRPVYAIYGPVTNPAVYLHNNDGSGDSTVRFDTGYQIPAGHYLAVDCARKTAYTDGDPTQPAMTSIDWVNTTWPTVNPYLGAAIGANVGVVTMGGSSTSAITQVVASWQDRFLT